MKTKMKSKTLAILISLAMTFTAMPVLGSPAYADAPAPDISFGPQQLAEKVNTEEAQIVWYGGRAWHVIAYDGKDARGNMVTYKNPAGGTENLYQEGAITLFQSDVLEQSSFNYEGDDWTRDGFQAYGADTNGEPSDLRKAIEAIYLSKDNGTPVLSNDENLAVLPRTLPGYGYIWSSYTQPDAYDSNRISNKDLEDARVWPLSDAEVMACDGSIRRGYSKSYWLRTPGHVDKTTIKVRYGAKVDNNGDVKNYNTYTGFSDGVRPGLYLDMEKVLFTSSANSGKASGKPGPGALKRISDNADNEWKVTLFDRDHNALRIVNVSGNMDCREALTVRYSNAKTGNNEYISGMITDKNENITYYGRLKKCAESGDAAGEVTINLKNKYRSGDKLYLFSEQANGDEKTDLASRLYEIPVPEAKHPLDKTEAADPTCTDPGNREYWTCGICHRYFGDGDGKKEIEEDSWIIPAKGHKPVEVVEKKATPEHFGWGEEVCTVCQRQTGIGFTCYYPDTFEISPKICTYDGKQKKPTVTVKDVAHNKTIPASEYEVIYKNNVNAGTAKATVNFIGKYYEGSEELCYNITAKKIKPTVTCAAVTYNGKARKPAVTVKDGKTLLKEGKDYTVAFASGLVRPGSYKVSVTLKGNYAGSGTGQFTIKKAANPLSVKGKNVNIKYNAVKKKTQVLPVSKVMSFTKKGQGQMSYSIYSAKKGRTTYIKYFKINKTNGKLTAIKGLPKGTYTLIVKARAAGNACYKASTYKTVTFKVTVK